MYKDDSRYVDNPNDNIYFYLSKLYVYKKYLHYNLKNIRVSDIIFIGHVNKLFSYLICKHICKRQYVHLVQSNTQI